MKTLDAQLQQSRSLLAITELVRNKSAFIALFSTLIGCALLFAMFAALGASMGNQAGAIIGFVGLVISFLLFVTGFSATGFLLTDQIHNRPQRTVGSAFLAGLVTLPRLFGVQLMILGLALLALLTMVLLLLVAKIPALGPFIYFFVYPVCILISALTIFGMFYIAVLSGPAIWNGNPAFKTISLMLAILKTRLFSVILQQFLLGLIVFLTLSVLFAVISGATTFTSLLSVPILSIKGGDLGRSATMILGGGGFEYANGYMIAAAIDLTLLGAAAVTLPLLMFTAGNCLIFQNATQGLDTEEIEKSISSGLKKIREQTEAAKEKLNEVKATLPQVQPATPLQAPVQASLNCSACGEKVSEDDLFCGSCGNKIK